ncbi:VWA domain-containing protein [Fibrobacter sp. UWH4]|uniref:VWA domain-containing protein n=1 Tax=Fibrobacter sp. UWH4 TaxID=1896210 RepID=UPI001114F7D5|nr:VWA domain-containing protein [Fibrobacter sp. UWH4]
MAGIAALCMSCSDDSNSLNASDAGKDDGKIADTIIQKNPNIETENGATFETKGTTSYNGDVMAPTLSGAIYDEAVTPTREAITDEYLAVDGAPIEYYDGGVYEGDYNGKTYGLLTASEWNDLDNWKDWGEILTGEFYDKASYWEFYPHTLVAVQVVDESGTGLANVSVELLKNENVEFATRTDNKGFAYCWANLFDGYTEEVLKSEDFSLKVNGKVSEDPVKLTTKNDESLNVNTITSDAKQADAKADVAFIVDATGSMGDEIRFLQSDLSYIIDHASSATNVALRTAVVFYRDDGDEYLTRGKDFSTNVANTQAFIKEQEANGGGDYPEAVHSALEATLQNFSWNESARARIAFLILDAPPHHQDSIIESLKSSITFYAKNGIKLIPVAASGIGYSHIEASVGESDVEKLADLMLRLIKKYVE